MKFSAKKALLAGTALVAVSFVISAQAAPGQTVSTSTTVTGTPTGGNGANGGSEQDGATGDPGLLFNNNTITVLNNSIATGGIGGVGGPSNMFVFSASGGNGGSGARLPSSQNGTSTSNHITLTNGATRRITGGAGGAGGEAQNAGGTGGLGGDGVYTDSDFTVINNAGTISGGIGGNGGAGNAFGFDVGGPGGAGGIGINVLSNNVTISNTGTIIGGAGGNGGTGGQNGDNGATSDAVYIDIASTGNTITNQAAGQILGQTANGVQVAGTLDLLTNAGTISTTTGNGVLTQGTLTQLTNTGTIVETGGGSAVNVRGIGGLATLNNDNGDILSTTGRAISVDDNFQDSFITLLTNNGGTISTTSGMAIDNDSAQIGMINNDNGHILGGTGYAIYNFDGATIGTITNDGGTITGSVTTVMNYYGNIDMLDNSNGLLSSTGSGGIALLNYGFAAPTIGQILNNGGTISATDGAAIQNEGTIGTIDNSGTNSLISVTSGIALYNHDGAEGGGPITLINNDGGTISTTTGYGIVNERYIGTISNVGGIIRATGIGGQGILNTNTIDTLTNTGTISAATNGGFAIDNDSGIIGILDNSGVISAGNNSTALFNGSTITSLVNTGTISATTGTGLFQLGSMALDNSNGVISATTGTAIELDAPLTGNLTNAGGMITSASTGNGTFYVNTDVGDLVVAGGLVTNTGTSNSSVALNIAAAQDPANHIIIFDDADLIADGNASGSGHGIAVAAGNNAASVAFANGSTVRGNINAGSGGFGLTLNSADIIGNVTTGSGNDFLTVNGSNNTLTGTTNLGTGTDALNISSDFTTGGTISAATLNTTIGALVGDFTVDHAVNLGTGTLDVGTDSIFSLNNANLTTTGLFTNSGTTNIGLNRTLTVGGIDTSASGIISYTADNVGGALTTGYIDAGASAADLSNQTVNVNYIGSDGLNVSTRSLIATGTGAATVPVTSVIDSSYLYNFSISRDSNNTNELYLQALFAQSQEEAASNENNRAVADILLGDDINNSDPVIQEIRTNLANAPDRESYNETLEATQPTTDNGAGTAAASFAGQVFDVADSQLAMVDTGDETGVAAGETADGLHPWIQGFGQHADQGERGGVDGYQANTYGGAIGVDTRNFHDDTVLGLSFAYGKTNVNSDNANSTDTDVDSYQGTVYGNHSFGDSDYFVAGMGAFGWNNNDVTRHNIGGIEDLDANADYDSWYAATRAEVGRNFRFGGQLAGAVLTPMLMADYVHYDSDSYTETGAGGANLSVDGEQQNTLNLGVGGRAQWRLRSEGGMQYKPDIHASYQYDVLDDDKVDTSSTFQAGGGTFSTSGLDPANSTVVVGAGLKIYNAGDWDFTTTYDHTFKSDYDADSGMIRAAYKF